MGEGSGEDFASILGLFQDLQIAPAIAGVSPVTMYSLSTMKQVTSHSKSIGAIAFPLGSLKKRRTSYCSLVNCSFRARKQHRQLAEKRSRETSGCRGARSELGSLHPQTEGTKKVTLFIVRVIMRKKKAHTRFKYNRSARRLCQRQTDEEFCRELYVRESDADDV